MAVSRIQDEVLQCSICYDVFQSPKTLPCLHTFCLDCLSTYIRQFASRVGFLCPICKDLVKSPFNRKSPQEWAASFRTNFHLDKLKTALEAEENDSGSTNSMCQVHPKTVEDLFCVPCDKQICHLCSGIDHKSCNLVVTLQEMEENRRADAQAVKIQMSDALQKSRDDVMRVKQQLDKVEVLKEGCKADVRRYSESLVSAIRRREEELVEGVEQRFNMFKDRVDIKIDNFREEQRRFHQRILLVERIVEGDTSNDAVKKFSRITSSENMQLDTSGILSLCQQLEKVCVNFIPAHSSKKMTSYTNLGHVVFEKSPTVKTPKPESTSIPPRVAFCDDNHITLKVNPQISRFSKRRSYTITQSNETSSQPGKVSKLKTISCKHHHDKHSPRLIDIEVLQSNQDDQRSFTILVTDWNNECVKAYNSRRDRDSRLPVGGKPWSITALSQTAVAISIPLSKQICVLGVGSSLVITSSVMAEKKYSGLVALTKTSLAACAGTVPPSVDIIDLTGDVLKSFSLDREGAPLFIYPAYICSNPRGDIIVSDRDTKSVLCMNQNGGVRWRFQPEGRRELEDPAGVTCNSQGDLYVVEKRGMLCLSSEGQLKGPVLKERDGVESLNGVWAGRNGWLFITNKDDEICEFRVKST